MWNRVAIASICCAALASSAAASAVEIRSASFIDRWVEPTGELRIRFARLLEPGEGQLTFVDGTVDLTPFFRHVTPGEYVYDGKQLPLATGQRQLKVFLVKDGAWTELRSFGLKVTTESGFERFDLKPRLDVSMKSQLDQGRGGSAPQFARRNYHDYGLQGGLGVDAVRGDLRMSGNANVVGSTFQGEALRFGQRGEHAPQVDISDYLMSAQWGRSQLTLGHISYGNNPLMFMNYGSRGMTFRHQLTDRADFSFNAMNGTSITGANNILGLDHDEHQVRSGTLGVEMLARKGGLRAEVQFLDASLQSLVPFNTGAIPDAERIRGGGLRVLGSDASGRLRGDLVLARVKHTAAADPILAQGQTLTEIKPVTKDARSIDLSYDLVKAAPGAATRFPFTLTALLHHDRIEPLFKSVGVGFASDQLLNRVGLAAQLGPLQAQWQASRREDNLTNIPTLLKTRSSVEGLTLNLPLAQVWPGPHGAPRPWLPSVGYRYEKNHQRAINVPIAALSAFNVTHLPDQFNELHSLSANWFAAQWQFSYSYNYATQDNRQPGREAADFQNIGHSVQAGYRFAPTFGVTAGTGRTANYANERALMSYTYNYSAGFDWQFWDLWSMSGNYALTTGNDSRNFNASRGWATHTQIARRFTLPSPTGGRPLPGQMFLRHVLNDNYSRDNVFGLLTAGRFWMIQSGITVSFF